MQTYSAKSKSEKKSWYYVDAKGKILGRLASKLSLYLQGKHKTQYTPHVDTGDYIIVINASKIILTGKKYKKKTYYKHSGYPGGLKKITFKDMIIKKPEKIIEIAVKGMLPKGPLGRKMFKKLKVFSGIEHKHTTQKPKKINFNKITNNIQYINE
ncbi:MAG: 50S ribosomal subunit protein L13 [Candidatus Westeberhardia cardiocondylae]|nr:50S ribosomal subunit protein L13 [Candidatus Westeberhardia cardiocondylae]